MAASNGENVSGEHILSSDDCQWPTTRGTGCTRGADSMLLGLNLCWQHEAALLHRVECAVMRALSGPKPDSPQRVLHETIKRSVAQALPTAADVDNEIRFAAEQALEDAAARRAQREQEARKQASVVYFAERDGFVKIGTTIKLRDRLNAISKGSCTIDGMTVGPVTCLATVPGDRTNEKFFHRKFAHLRVAGEWFLLDDDLWAFINGLKGRAAVSGTDGRVVWQAATAPAN